MTPRSVEGIQYLRAVAALMVVGHHARHYFGEIPGWSGFGATGVDIFFAISGFVMALSTRSFRDTAQRPQQAARFLLNRVIRVVPLYWLALLWTYKHGGEPLGALAMDFVFVPRWNPEQHMVAPRFVPGWTINYEMFFYALFAACMLVSRWRYALLAGVLASLCVLGALRPSTPAGMFFTSSVLLDFLLGIGVYFATRQPAEVPRPLLLLVGGAAFIGLGFDTDLPRGLYFGPLAAIVLWAAVIGMRDVKLPALTRIGDASYSVYLFHIATFNTTGKLCRWLGFEQRTLGTIVAVVGLHVLIATLAGLVIHAWVERPLLDRLQKRLRRAPAAPQAAR